MIRIHDGAIPRALCERAVDAIRRDDAPLLAELLDELHAEHVHTLLCDYIVEAGLSVSRSSYLPDLSRLTREGPRPDGGPARSEPVPWPVSDGVCFVACLNDGASDSERVFPRQDRRVEHRRGRVLLFPTSWTHDYVLRAGSAELFSLVVFAAVARDTRLTDLDPELNVEEQRCAELLSAPDPAPSAPWFPAPPLGA